MGILSGLRERIRLVGRSVLRTEAHAAELAAALNIQEAGILEVMNLYARIDLHSATPSTPAPRS